MGVLERGAPLAGISDRELIGLSAQSQAD